MALRTVWLAVSRGGWSTFVRLRTKTGPGGHHYGMGDRTGSKRLATVSRIARLSTACGVLAALAACTQVTITLHGRGDGQEDGETNGATGDACPEDTGTGDTGSAPVDAQPDSPFDPDGPPLEAGADDATCSDDDAGDADVLDAGGEDASDAGTPTDAGGEESDSGPAPSSDVTCTFTRAHSGSSDCTFCVLPPEQTITVDHVPIFIDHASGGYEGQPPLPPPPRRVIHVDASSVFDAWGVGNAFILSGSPPSESWTNTITVLGGSVGGTINVGSSNATNVSLSGTHLPGTPGCMVIRGCYSEKIACSGTAVAEDR